MAQSSYSSRRLQKWVSLSAWKSFHAKLGVLGILSLAVGGAVIGAVTLGGIAHWGVFVAQSSTERCFFPATWQKSDGSTFEGTLNCLKDKTDCREGAAEGPLASGVAITGEASGCYIMNYGSTGETSGSSGSMESWCAAWKAGTCAQECGKYGMSGDSSCISGCQNMTESQCNGSYQGGGSTGGSTGGSGGGSTTGGSTTGTSGGGSTGMTAFDSCMDGCSLPRTAAAEQKKESTCYMSYCKSMDPNPPSEATQSSSGNTGSQESTGGGYSNTNSMKNCFYPHATINGASPGYTVWCEGDYVNCHKGDPSGAPVSTNGLALGAPSQCDSGWGDSGGGMYGGGDMYCYDQYGPTGTRPSSSQCSSLPCNFQGNGVTIKCVRPDQAPTGGSNTGNGNMEEWCAAWRSNTCQATCDKYKGTMTADESGRCVDGCKTMTESMCNGSYNGGGSYNGQPVRCVYPNGVTLYCRAPHVDCSKTQGGPILTSQQVGANGSTAQCDPVSGGHDGGTNGGADSCIASCNSSFYDSNGGYDECRRRCGGSTGGTGYSSSTGYQSRTPPSSEGYRGAAPDGAITWRKNELSREIADLERQVSEARTSAHEAGTNVSAQVQELLSKVGGAKTCIGAATSGQALVECDKILMKARELSRTIWNTIQRGYEDKNRKMWDRQIGEMENVIGQMAGADVSNLQQILSELKAAIAHANSVSGNTNTTEELSRKAWQRVDDLQSQFWKETNAFRPGGNEEHEGYGRSPTEACERMKVEAQHADPSVQVKIKALVQECFGIMEKSTVGSAGGEGEMRQAMEGLMQKFGTIMSSSWQRGACDDARSGVDEARNAVTGFAPMMIRKVQTQNPGTATMLEGLLTTARSILARAEQALQRNDCDAAMKEMSGMDTKVRVPFEAAMAKEGFDSMDEDEEFTLVNYDKQYGEIYQRAGEHGAQYEDFARSMKEKGYGLGELNVLKTIDPKLMGIAQKSEGAEVVKAATSANVDRVKLEELLAAKDAIIVQLEKQVQNLQAGMAAVVTRIAKYTPHPSVAGKLSELVDRAGELSPEEFQKEFDAIDFATRAAAVEDGWTYFTDAYHFDPQQQWYAGAVNEMSDRGVFTGTDPQNHIFGAGQTANGAELVTVLARVVGMEDGAKPTSEYAGNLPDWAASAGGTLDRLLPGSLDTYLSGEAGRGVTRMEIALLIADLFGDDLPATDSDIFENFQDAQQIPAYARKAIASVVVAGIITGQEREGGKFFDPEGTVTREQLATILARLLLLLEDEGESDTPAGSTAAAAPSSETDGEPVIEAEKKPAAPPAPTFDLASITKGEATLVYSLLLKEYDDIVEVMQSASAEEKLETWVPKKNAVKDAIKTWERINIEKTYEPFSSVPTYKMNIANKLMLDQVNVINDILRNPTARAQ